MATDDSRPRRPCRYTYSIPAFEFVRESLLHIPDNDACLEWPRGRRNGYGNAYDPVKMRNRYAHQIAYELTFGSIPSGLDVLHKCDNPPCFRPSHLFLGTHQDNMRDCVAKGRKHNGDRRPRIDSAKVVGIIEHSARGASQLEIARTFSVSARSVGRILKREAS